MAFKDSKNKDTFIAPSIKRKVLPLQSFVLRLHSKIDKTTLLFF